MVDDRFACRIGRLADVLISQIGHLGLFLAASFVCGGAEAIL
jgi:hypothetical protein